MVYRFIVPLWVTGKVMFRLSTHPPHLVVREEHNSEINARKSSFVWLAGTVEDQEECGVCEQPNVPDFVCDLCRRATRFTMYNYKASLHLSMSSLYDLFYAHVEVICSQVGSTAMTSWMGSSRVQ